MFGTMMPFIRNFSYTKFENEICSGIKARLCNVGYLNNSSIERVEEFRYLGTTLTYHNSIQEEI